MEFKQFLTEFNQPTNAQNPTDQPGKNSRYTSATGARSAMQSKTTRITRKDRMDLVKSKDLQTVKNQVDVSFKQILAAADNTPIESFIIGRLNQIKRQIDQKIDQEMKKQERMKK